MRLAALTGDHQWREKADRLIEGIIAAQPRNLFGHVSLLNALDLRLRAAEIVCTGPDAEAFAQAALKLPYLDRVVLRAPSADALPATHPGAGEAEGCLRQRRLRLRRRDMFAAGHGAREDRRRGGGDVDPASVLILPR